MWKLSMWIVAGDDWSEALTHEERRGSTLVLVAPERFRVEPNGEYQVSQWRLIFRQPVIQAC